MVGAIVVLIRAALAGCCSKICSMIGSKMTLLAKTYFIAKLISGATYSNKASPGPLRSPLNCVSSSLATALAILPMLVWSFGYRGVSAASFDRQFCGSRAFFRNPHHSYWLVDTRNHVLHNRSTFI